MKTTLLIAASVLATIGPAVEASARQTPSADKRVYTVCTLLVGRRNLQPPTATTANATKKDGSTVTMFVESSNPLTPSESVQVGADLAKLQESLKSSFQLESIDAVASLGGWMAVGREMLLQAPGTPLKLLVTASGVVSGVEPPMVATRPRSGGDSSEYERAYAAGVMGVHRAAQYQVKLTMGVTDVLDRWMSVNLGQRSVFARQPQPNGPVYFVVVAAPLIETAQGLAIGGVVGAERPIRGPMLVSGPDPLLPEDVRRRIKSALILRATIGTDGAVQDIKVMDAVEGVTERAVAALKLRRYEPALDENGRPIAVQIVVAIRPSDEPD